MGMSWNGSKDTAAKDCGPCQEPATQAAAEGVKLPVTGCVLRLPYTTRLQSECLLLLLHNSEMADDKKDKKKKVTKKKEEEAPAESPAPAAETKSSSVKSGSTKRAKRTGSNVFSMFSQRQVQEFKEAFQLMDSDKDGIIGKSDLRVTFDSLGRIANDNDLVEMLAEAPGPINFTMFLSIFGDRISGTDDEDVILNAFAQYDEGDGKCSSDKLKHDLMTWGEKFKASEVEDAFDQAPIDDGGFIDLKKFATVLTKGVEDEEDQAAA